MDMSLLVIDRRFVPIWKKSSCFFHKHYNSQSRSSNFQHVTFFVTTNAHAVSYSKLGKETLKTNHSLSTLTAVKHISNIKLGAEVRFILYQKETKTLLRKSGNSSNVNKNLKTKIFSGVGEMSYENLAVNSARDPEKLSTFEAQKISNSLS